MKRSRGVLLVAHCVLNANSKVEGLSKYPGAMDEVVKIIMASGAGIIQLPCPEMLMYGVRRWGHAKEQLDNPFFRANCRKILEPIKDQIIDYQKNGYRIVGCIGIDGSPSCGVENTCSGNWGGELLGENNVPRRVDGLTIIQKPGVFIEEMQAIFRENQLDIPFIAIDEMDIHSNIDQIKNFITL